MWFASAWHLMDWNERRFPYWVLMGGLFGHIFGLLISTKMLSKARFSDVITGSVTLPEAQDKESESFKED